MRGLVNRAGDEFLTGSGFTRDQHALGVPRNPVHHAHEPVHKGTGDDKVYAFKRARHSVHCFVFFRILSFCGFFLDSCALPETVVLVCFSSATEPWQPSLPVRNRRPEAT